MKFVDLNNIRELKEILTPYILIVLKEKYMETYQRKCLDKINEEYKKGKHLVTYFTRYSNRICHYSSISDPNPHKLYHTYDKADFPKRFKYTSGMNHPTGFKELKLRCYNELY